MEIEKFLSERFSYLKLMKIYIKKRSGIVGRYERVWESIKNWISLFLYFMPCFKKAQQQHLIYKD